MPILERFHCTMEISSLQDSLDSVEALLRKHNDYEKTLNAQEDKINSLDQFGQKLVLGNHYKSDVVATRREAVLQR